MGRRRFGEVRQLRSGRWQARYNGPDGIDRPAPYTFAGKGDAERWLTLKEAEIARGEWIDPEAGKVTFREYARAWVEERPNLRLRTAQLYDGLCGCTYFRRSRTRPSPRSRNRTCGGGVRSSSTPVRDR